MTVRTPGCRAMKARPPRSIRRSTLAVALALAAGGVASPAFAYGCKYDRTGDSVVLSRNALDPEGSNSYYGYGSNQPSVAFDATGLDRLELSHCRMDEIAHDTLVTDRPIEIVIDNGVISPGSMADPHDTFIDLSKRFVNAKEGSSAHNRLVIDGGRILSTRGTDGPVPFDVMFNGGAFGGAFNTLVFDPNQRIRDGDTFTANAGIFDGSIFMGGGADTVQFSGGDGNYLMLYGDGGTFKMADLNTFGNRFDDTFTFAGGKVDAVHGDSGNDEVQRDATGRYMSDGGPAGNDRFTLDGGWVRTIYGDDGDDRLDVRGDSSLGEFRGGFGSDTVDIAAGASLDHLYSFEGDADTSYNLFNGRDSDVDVIRFHGQTFEADSDGNQGCLLGGTDCRKHVDIHGFERVELLDGARMTILDRFARDGAQFGRPYEADRTRLVIDATSTLVARHVPTLVYPATLLRASVSNDGTVDLGQDATGDVLEVYGDWTGTGRVLMSTVFAGDDSATDRLRIDGNATGRTVLDIAQAAGSTGAQTVDGILVVDTRGTSTSDAFVLAAPVTTANGLWQYRLEKATTGTHAGKFVLTSAVPAKDPPVTPPPTTPPGGTTPPPGTGTGTPTAPSDGNARLLAPLVTTAATAAPAAQMLVVDGLADVDARAAAVRDLADSAHDGRVWMLAGGDRLRTHGDRFGEDLRRMSLRAGVDLQNDANAQRGVMFAVAQADGEAEDRLRPTIDGYASRLSADIGAVRVRAFTAGGYQTLRWASGLMLDVTGEAGLLQARLKPDGSATQHPVGWTAALSTTVGRAFTAGTLRLTPQAQLVAAHVSLDGLDGNVTSDRLTQNALRTRIGLRAENASPEGLGWHVSTNLWRELHETNDAVFTGGSDSTAVRPSVARNWAEVAAGLQRTRGASTWFVDLRGERGIGSGKRLAVGAQAGLRMAW